MPDAPAKIEVEGLRDLRRALKQMEGGLGDLKAANREAAEIVADGAQRFVPRRSGALAASIRAAGQASAGVVRAGFRSVPYAGPIHFGWAAHSIAPNPFIYDALDARAGEVEAAYEAQIEALKKANGLD